MKVLVTSKSFGKVAPDAVDLLIKNGIEIVRGSKPSMSAAEIAAEIGGFDALVVGNDTVDAQAIAAADKLKIVHMHGTGTDAIDIAAASRRGIYVANAPGANSNAVAELTVGLMLVAARAIDRHAALLRAGEWHRTAGCEISGKTLGVFGLGAVGRRVVHLLKGFDMPVVGYDIQPDRAWAAEMGVTLADTAESVFAQADFLVLALSLNDQTRRVVDAARLALMKPSAFLINTARGALVDTAALCMALREKRIGGAAIDVFDPEPLAADSELRTVTATLTPHLAATSIESTGNVSRIVARNLIDVLIFGRTECAVNRGAVEGGAKQ